MFNFLMGKEKRLLSKGPWVCGKGGQDGWVQDLSPPSTKRSCNQFQVTRKPLSGAFFISFRDELDEEDDPRKESQ